MVDFLTRRVSRRARMTPRGRLGTVAAFVCARSHGPLPITERTSESLIRLPLHAGIVAAVALTGSSTACTCFFHGPQ